MKVQQKSIATLTTSDRRIFMKWAARQVQELPLQIFSVSKEEAAAICGEICQAMLTIVKSVEGKIQPKNVVRCVARAVRTDMAKANEMVITVSNMLFELFEQWVGNRVDKTRMLSAYTRKHCAWRTMPDGQTI